ncbi:hypothetical protein BJ994_003226 [Arthrobacter pigmenti]|uniref:Uncharacterized protein n=1 Tax=Arthrobacter pigmenti TaxID=271432 RepID=A0A846RRG7_9MICC|nr:hypothetical protein [Arthrobacter pigmenti]NJC24150.1 hypothetical protein [Arthrobacter pigmenti]
MTSQSVHATGDPGNSTGDQPHLPPPSTLPAQPAQPVQGTSLKDLEPARWIHACLSGALAYGLTVVGALLALLLMILGAVLSPQDIQGSVEGFTGASAAEFGSLFLFIAVPFQLAGMGLFGTLQGEMSVNILGAAVTVGGSGWFVPLALTGITVLTLAFVARRAARKQPTTTAQAWALSAASGAALAVVALLLGILFAVRLEEEGTSITLSSVSWSLFLGSLVIGTLASRVGRSMGARRNGPLAVTAARRTVAGVSAAFRVVGLHYLTYTLIGGSVLLIGTFVFGGAVAGFAALSWLPNLAGWMYGIGHLSVVRQVSTIGSDNVSTFDWPMWATLLSLLLTIALAAAASVAWALARRNAAGWASWLVLPAVFLTCGLAITLLSTGSFEVQGGIFAASGSIALAPWTLLILALWGGTIEASSRFVAPWLVPYVPAKVRRFVAGPRDTNRIAVAQDPHTGALPASAQTTIPLDAQDEDQAAEPKPLSPQAKKKLKIGAVVAGVVVVLGIGAAVTYNVLATSTYGPQAQVEKYLQALQDGDASTAVEIVDPNVPSAERLLLSDEIYGAAENRITAYEIRDVEQEGDTAIVTAEITQDSQTTPLTFTLEKGDSTAVIFHEWRVAHGSSWTLPVQVPTGFTNIAVNGVDVEIPAQQAQQAPGTFAFAVLPGTYVITPPEGTRYVTLGEAQTVTVSADPTVFPGEGAIFEPSMTGALTEDAIAQVQAHLAGCMAAKESEPAGCPNSAFTFGDEEDYRNFIWTMTEEPTFEVTESWNGLLLTSDGGVMTVTYEQNTNWLGDEPEWEKQEEQMPLYFSAPVQIEGDKLTVVFEE